MLVIGFYITGVTFFVAPGASTSSGSYLIIQFLVNLIFAASAQMIPVFILGVIRSVFISIGELFLG